jgi:hypothetical protein
MDQQRTNLIVKLIRGIRGNRAENTGVDRIPLNYSNCEFDAVVDVTRDDSAFQCQYTHCTHRRQEYSITVRLIQPVGPDQYGHPVEAPDTEKITATFHACGKCAASNGFDPDNYDTGPASVETITHEHVLDPLADGYSYTDAEVVSASIDDDGYLSVEILPAFQSQAKEE